MDHEAFKKANLPDNFNYFLGVPAEKTMPEFICQELLEKVRTRLPCLTNSDSRDVDAILKERHRLVEFSEAYDYM